MRADTTKGRDGGNVRFFGAARGAVARGFAASRCGLRRSPGRGLLAQAMRGWLADFFRGLGAPWYWNARKAWFVARGRRGQCPCQNASDSGAPGETRCEAVTYWHNPRRFARVVCPLLQENAEGEWRCSARPENVRSFWGRVVVIYAALLALAIGGVGGGIWLTMRHVGYAVSLRQIFWPRAWSELPGVRAEFFRRQAGEHLQQGKFREAIAALTLASELAPGDYTTGMLLAQIDHLARPDQVDLRYRRLYGLHPAHRDETARVWFRSMLARAEMTGVGELAHQRLTGAPAEWPVWLHALLLACRWQQQWTLLEAAAANGQVPAPARAVLELELKIRRGSFSEARRLLIAEAIGPEPYGVLHRIERLVEFGDGFEALQILRERGYELGQRDVVRLTLAAHAVARNRVALEREVRGLLARAGEEGELATAMVGQHLVRYPNEQLLGLCRDAVARWPAGESASRSDALAAVYCAVAVGGRVDWLPEVRARFPESQLASVTTQQRIEQLFAQPGASPLALLLVVRPVSLELNYALLERALALR